MEIAGAAFRRTTWAVAGGLVGTSVASAGLAVFLATTWVLAGSAGVGVWGVLGLTTAGLIAATGMLGVVAAVPFFRGSGVSWAWPLATASAAVVASALATFMFEAAFADREPVHLAATFAALGGGIVGGFAAVAFLRGRSRLASWSVSLAAGLLVIASLLEWRGVFAAAPLVVPDIASLNPAWTFGSGGPVNGLFVTAGLLVASLALLPLEGLGPRQSPSRLRIAALGSLLLAVALVPWSSSWGHWFDGNLLGNAAVIAGSVDNVTQPLGALAMFVAASLAFNGPRRDAIVGPARD